jgi:class 3 adenylate cyclase
MRRSGDDNRRTPRRELTAVTQLGRPNAFVFAKFKLGMEGCVEAERRQVTVLFTDLVDFTTFSERSGEEAAYTLMRSLSKLMGECVREEGGIVQGFTGDGIMAVFGAPVAFEDAPLRACRAALSILHRLNEAGPELEAKHGVRQQMRIGLNTGGAFQRK